MTTKEFVPKKREHLPDVVFDLLGEGVVCEHWVEVVLLHWVHRRWLTR